MSKIIRSQTEANYYTERNNCTEMETIFELEDGRFFKGERVHTCNNEMHTHQSQSPATFKAYFLKWIKDPKREYGRYEDDFQECQGQNFDYN